MTQSDSTDFQGQVCLAVVAALLAVGGWLYMQRVLIGHQIREAAVTGTPRGNLSDLYPRWIGAQELLLYGRDPYDPELAHKIQTGYYGRPINPSRPGDPSDQQAFAYPAYVVFYLAPTLRLPFGVVQKWAFWALLAVTLASIPFWLCALGWQVSPVIQFGMMALMLASIPVMQALKLQQLTLLVAGMCAAAMALVVLGRPISAGLLLALATIKPQLVLPLILWLGIWTLGDVKRRYRWCVSFLVVVVALSAAAEWFLPHWIERFRQAAKAYLQYTKAVPIIESVIPYPWGRLLEGLFIGMTAYICWKWRKHPENSHAFQLATCLVMGLTVLMVPTFSLYNQVLLLPALLLIARDRALIRKGSSVGRALLIIVVAMLVWPWFSTTALAVLSFILPLEEVQRAWAIPSLTVLHLPAVVAGLMLVYCYRMSATEFYQAG